MLEFVLPFIVGALLFKLLFKVFFKFLKFGVFIFIIMTVVNMF